VNLTSESEAREMPDRRAIRHLRLHELMGSIKVLTIMYVLKLITPLFVMEIQT
jgi:hypothetical protein